MKNIAVLAGGYTSERDISLNSGRLVFDNIDRNLYNPYFVEVNTDGLYCTSCEDRIKVDLNNFSFLHKGEEIKFDYAYIALHGAPGEDGKIQGYLDIVNVPHSACDVFAASVTFDKAACKSVLENTKVNLAKSVLIKQGDNYSVDEIVNFLGLPCFVKPNTAGSSYGVSKVYEAQKLEEAINLAYTEDKFVIIEEFIDGVEVSCGIFKTVNEEYVLGVTEIDTKNDFFDTEAKYQDGLTDEITPARISQEETRLVEKATSLIYDIVACRGIIRVDYIIKEGKPYFLEVNSIPGMSAESIVPRQIAYLGKTVKEVLTQVIESSFS